MMNWLTLPDPGDAPLAGTFVQAPSALVVEYLARLPFAFLCLDAEHSPFDLAATHACIRAADLHGRPVLVRVAGTEPVAIAQALDAGAAGIVVPRVESAAAAARAVDAARYPPAGSRGCGPGRAAGYGRNIADYLAQADAQVRVVCQVETRTAVEQLAAICEVPGVDMVLIGPGDLAVSCRGAAGTAPPDASALVDRILEGCRAARMPVAVYAGDAEAANRYAQAGIDAVLLASELQFLEAGATAALAALTFPSGDAQENGENGVR